MSEPVSLAEARAQVNILDAGDTTYDDFLTAIIPQARAVVERQSRFFFVATTRTETFRAWGDTRFNSSLLHPGCGQFLEIYRRPIASLGDITYTDADGADQTLDTGLYLATLDTFPVRISPAVDDSFPALGRGGRISVTYTSGALADTSEEYLAGKRAMLLLIGHWFANREGVIADVRAAVADVPWTVTAILDDLRPASAY